MAETDSKELLQGFDCLMVCLQLALSWDDKRLKKIFKKHDLLKENPRFDLPFALYQLHHEFHNPESRIAQELIEFFNRTYRKQIQSVAALECDPQSPELLEPTTEMLRTDPAGSFWALATDPRVDLHSLSTYHAHRMLLEAFQANVGTVWRCDRLKAEHKAQKTRLHELETSNNALKSEVAKLRRENAALKQRLQSSDQDQRELRMLRYELSKSHPGRTLPATPSTPVAAKSDLEELLIEKDATCPFRQKACCERAQAGKCTLENVKVALVGGIERLENQYRNTFESLGAAKFYFHSGHCDGAGAEKLRNTTEAADIVIFVTRVNSHNALNVLKGVCKKSGKSFLAVRETSPEQISRIVLDEVNKQTVEN